MEENTEGIRNDVPIERRKFPRLNTSVDIEYKILLKGASQEKKATTKNISGGGICLIVYEKIDVGSSLALRFYLRDMNCDIKAKARAIWSSYFTVGPDGRDRYDLGIEFTEINESDRQKISEYVFKLIS